MSALIPTDPSTVTTKHATPIQPSGALLGVRVLGGWFTHLDTKPTEPRRETLANDYACSFHITGATRTRSVPLFCVREDGGRLRIDPSFRAMERRPQARGRRTPKVFTRAAGKELFGQMRRQAQGETIVQVDCYYGQLAFEVAVVQRRKRRFGKKMPREDTSREEVCRSSLRLSAIATACQSGSSEFTLILEGNCGVVRLEILYFKIPYRIKQDPEDVVASMVRTIKKVIELGYNNFARIVLHVIQSSSVFLVSRVLSSREYLDKRMNLLEFAAFHGKAEIVKSILKRGYSPLKALMEDKELCSLGLPDVHLAAHSREIAAFEAIIDGKCSWLANRHVAQRLDRRALALADQELLNIDLSISPDGADEFFVDRKDSNGYTALAYVAASPNERFSLQATKFLVARGANIVAKTTKEETPLIVSIKAGNVETALYLLSLKRANAAGSSYAAEPNIADATGKRPLMYACQRGDVNLVKRLLEVGATVMIYDRDGSTPLHEAAENGHAAVVALLLGALGSKQTTLLEKLHGSRDAAEAVAPLTKLLGLVKKRKPKKANETLDERYEGGDSNESMNERRSKRITFSPDVAKFIVARRWRCGNTALDLAENGLHLTTMHALREYCGHLSMNTDNGTVDGTDDEYSLNASFCLSNRSSKSRAG